MGQTPTVLIVDLLMGLMKKGLLIMTLLLVLFLVAGRLKRPSLISKGKIFNFIRKLTVLCIVQRFSCHLVECMY